MNISMLVYPDMTPLDLLGPLQAWSLWPGTDIQIVWKNTQPVPTDTGMAVVPTHSFDQAFAEPDILFAPGGAAGTMAVLKDPDVMEFMAGRGANASWVTSVCTGALVLGAAGLLNGYKATTHWLALDLLPNFGAQPVKSRWVIDRNRATGGGITAGIDFGLAIIAEIDGEQAAKNVQLTMEYSPQPPFQSGTPDEADAETIAAVRSAFEQALS
jgi:cyclohexyl-isocyanide hydratase